MVARQHDSAEDTIRTKRLELVDDEGNTQAVLEAGPDGPRFTLQGPSGEFRLEVLEGDEKFGGGPALRLTDRDGNLRCAIRVVGADTAVDLYGPEGNLGNPLASIVAHEGESYVTLDAIRYSPALRKRVPDPCVTLRGCSDIGGHVSVLDEALDPRWEEPLSRETFPVRLRERLLEAAGEALEAEGLEMTPDEFLGAFRQAAEDAEGRLGARG